MKRALLLLMLAVACSSDKPSGGGGGDDDRGDEDIIDPPGDSDDFVCSESPVTHVEIINACTDAEAIDKDPVLPRLNADGSLPALPQN